MNVLAFLKLHSYPFSVLYTSMMLLMLHYHNADWSKKRCDRLGERMQFFHSKFWDFCILTLLFILVEIHFSHSSFNRLSGCGSVSVEMLTYL